MLILIADDDSETCMLVTAILEQAGYRTIAARDAMQVMALATQRRPDLIVLDLQMPAGTGLGALEKLKLSAKTKPIPVVVLSGTLDPMKIDRLQALGAAGFLAKPVDAEALLEAVRSALEPKDA